MTALDDIRRAISNSYDRPQLTQAEKEKLSKAAHKMNAFKDQNIRLAYFIVICEENARLLKEVNEHRTARGFDPLPVIEPEVK